MKLLKSSPKPSKLKWPLVVRRVSGTSMIPTLEPGRLVLGSKVLNHYRHGDVIIIRHEGLEKIKRIKKIGSNNKLYVQGDNPSHSLDSRHFGYIDASLIYAKIILPTTKKDSKQQLLEI